MQRYQKINSELLALTYGAIVNQVINDSENLLEANEVLEKIGYNIGLKIVDQYMAKTSICSSFDQVVEGFARNGLRMFLGVTGEVKDYVFQSQKKEKNMNFHLVINENPLLNYVQLPSDLKPLEYQNILCGVIRGAFYTLNLTGRVFVIKDGLKFNNEPTVIRVQMKKQNVTYGDD